jgi:hypothetical protein
MEKITFVMELRVGVMEKFCLIRFLLIGFMFGLVGWADGCCLGFGMRVSLWLAVGCRFGFVVIGLNYCLVADCPRFEDDCFKSFKHEFKLDWHLARFWWLYY